MYKYLKLLLTWTDHYSYISTHCKVFSVNLENVYFFNPQTNVALVSPLLRLENNHCHIEESEYVLKKAHKYSELIILYEKKGLHQKGVLILLSFCLCDLH